MDPYIYIYIYIIGLPLARPRLLAMFRLRRQSLSKLQHWIYSSNRGNYGISFISSKVSEIQKSILNMHFKHQWKIMQSFLTSYEHLRYSNTYTQQRRVLPETYIHIYLYVYTSSFSHRLCAGPKKDESRGWRWKRKANEATTFFYRGRQRSISRKERHICFI
jgi:hypothetical protein